MKKKRRRRCSVAPLLFAVHFLPAAAFFPQWKDENSMLILFF
jgi:hypothetical protein